MRIRSVIGVFFTMILIGLTGCGSRGRSPEMFRVSGVIKLDGSPLKTGTINFTPTDGKNQVAGGTVTNGNYSVQVPPGPAKISISSPKVVGTQKAYDTPDSPTMDIIEEAIPAAYNVDTTLEHNATEAKRDLNFELKSSP
ncbi:MAG: hypothetical protein JSS49_03985 [Planctomycetes bacterium]|nr:hypothetical protein [Planctomycetota bacterium]